MLRLSAPRVHGVNAHYYRKFELDNRLFTRSRIVLERALRDGQELTRTELASILERAGIAVDRLRLAYLMMHAELDGVICSGARRGHQFTYALLEERVPAAPAARSGSGRAELTGGISGVTVPLDTGFVWWSGRPSRCEDRAEEAKPDVEEQRIDGRTLLVRGLPRPPSARAEIGSPAAQLRRVRNCI